MVAFHSAPLLLLMQIYIETNPFFFLFLPSHSTMLFFLLCISLSTNRKQNVAVGLAWVLSYYKLIEVKAKQ